MKRPLYVRKKNRKEDNYERTGEDVTIRRYLESPKDRRTSFERWSAKRRAEW